MAGGDRCQQNNHCNAKLASTHVGVEKHVCVPNVEVGMETNGEGKGKRKQPRHFLVFTPSFQNKSFQRSQNVQRFGQSSAERHARTACSTLLSEHTYTKKTPGAKTPWCQRRKAYH